MKTEEIFLMLGELDEKLIAKASEDLERHRLSGQTYHIEEKDKFAWKRWAIGSVCAAAVIFGVFFAVKNFTGGKIPYYPGGPSDTSDWNSSDTSSTSSDTSDTSDTSSTSSDTSSTSSDTSSTSSDTSDTSDTSSTSSETSSTTPVVPDDQPAYDDVFKEVVYNPTSYGPPLTYEEIVNSLKPDPDYPEYDTDSLYLVEVIKALSPEESKNVAGWRSDNTLYSVKILTDLGSGETINKIANVSATSGTVEYQEPGDPPYAPGDRFTAALTKPYEGRDYLSADYLFRYDVVEENGKTMLYSRSKGSNIDEQYLPTSEKINEKVITSTTKNPAEYTQKLELGALVDFWRKLQKDLIKYSETEFDAASPYPYQEALKSGRISPDAPKLDLATAKKIIAEKGHFEDIITEFEKVQPYPDYSKYTAVQCTKYCPTEYEVISMIWGDQGEIDYVQYAPDGTIKNSEVLFKTDYGYGTEPDPNEHFLFYISCSKDEFKRGDEFTVSVDIVNNMGKPYVYMGSKTGYRPEVKLYYSDKSENGGEFVIPYDPFVDTTEYMKYEIAPGELRSVTYRFKVPEDAPIGTYRLQISYENSEIGYQPTFFVVG